MHREPESTDKPVFFLKFSLSHKNLQLLIVQHNFLLSDVLHCINM